MSKLRLLFTSTLVGFPRLKGPIRHGQGRPPAHVALIDDFLPLTAYTKGFTNSAAVYGPGLDYEYAGRLSSRAYSQLLL